MELTLAYEIWADQSGIKEQVQELGWLARRNLQGRFKQLTSITSNDDLRKELSSADQTENERLAWYLLGQALDDQFRKPNPTLVLLDWQGLVAEFSGSSKRLTALGSFLRGLYLHKEENLFEALNGYKESMEHLFADGSYPYLVSICQFCMAELYANLTSIEDAQTAYDQALASLQAVPQADPRFRQAILTEKEKIARQYQLIREWTENVPESEWPTRFKRASALIDPDLVRLAKSWSMRHLAGEEFETGVCASYLVDRLNAYLKQPVNFREEMVNYLLSRKNYEQAEPILRVLVQEKKEEDLKVRLAVCLGQLRKHQEAIAILEEVLKQNPKNAEAHSALGPIFLIENNLPLAEQHLRAAIKYDPQDGMAQNFLKILEQEKEANLLEKARQQQANSFAFDPASKSLSINLNALNGDPEELSIQLMAAIIRGNPAEAETLLEAVRKEKGEATFRKLLALLAPSAAAEPGDEHFQKAEQLFGARKFPEAIAEYKQAIAANPQHWRGYMGMGDTYFMIGQFNLAAIYFEESINIHPEASTYRFLGDAYREQGNIDKAIEAYQNSVKTDPNYAPGQNSLQMALDLKRKKG